MTIAIFGATGHLGRHVVQSLLDHGVDPAQIVAAGRSIDKLDDFSARGVTVTRVDLSVPAEVDGVVSAATRVLLISGTEPNRVEQHQNVIDAAVRSGVTQLVYTSAPAATTTSMLLAGDHAETEKRLAASGLPSTVLRNAWYVENYTAQLPLYLEHGMVGAAGDGKVSIALRREYAEAAAVVLTTEGHLGKVYELGGEAVTLPEVADAISAASGATVTYANVPVDTLRGILGSAGIPAPMDTVLADVDRAISVGELVVDHSVLAGLLGRPVTPLTQAVAEALAR